MVIIEQTFWRQTGIIRIIMNYKPGLTRGKSSLWANLGCTSPHQFPLASPQRLVLHVPGIVSF